MTLDEGDGRLAVGSGTPVHAAGGKTLVLTNAHVVPADRREAPVSVSVGGKTYPARFVDGSGVTFGPGGRMAVDGPDLCLLEVDADLGAVPVATAVSPGDGVSQAGYGGAGPDDPPVVRRGRVQAAGWELALSYPVEPGDSGSGVLNAAGELVGVTVGRDPATRRGFAVPAAAVRAFLLRPRVQAHSPRLTPGLGVAGAAGTAAPPVAGRPDVADGLPAALTIEGKTYMRVPGAGSTWRPEPAPSCLFRRSSGRHPVSPAPRRNNGHPARQMVPCPPTSYRRHWDQDHVLTGRLTRNSLPSIRLNCLS